MLEWQDSGSDGQGQERQEKPEPIMDILIVLIVFTAVAYFWLYASSLS